MGCLRLSVCSTVLLLLLLLPSSTLQIFHRESHPLDRNTQDALTILRNVKRHVIRSSECRSWNESCDPWTSNPGHVCCDPDSFVCQCNLWMQNCRCKSRVWGK